MPRTHPPAASTLRNRNRITNKTRLRIHHGNIDADPIIPDEDEEKNRFLQSVAGVDQEDANEHHLQQVLSEAALRNQAAVNKKAAAPPPTAYIPTPDSTGVVDNYEELHPPNKWKDPHTYIYSSYTVEESVRDGLAGGWTYYMDERDKDFLDKNNEEARGEGTSAQGALSSPSSTRTSARSAKAKGKEPETSQTVVITEDEFELVMGLYEKFTHEKTEFLHHGLENGMTFPPFTDYQDAFSNPLPSQTFATFVAPKWIPQPSHLCRIARLIYPHWKERRQERKGHRIIPALNGDETDLANESYVCFRRRELKAVRKTRASQASSSDKLTRLQAELEFPLQLARKVLERETTKRDLNIASQHLWEKRVALADLKRKNPTAFGGEANNKADEELLIDKERPVKKPEVRNNGLKIPPKNENRTAGPAVNVEIAMRPKERFARIQHEVEQQLARQKEKDRDWEDVADYAYQAPPATPAIRAFRPISSASSSTSISLPSEFSKSGDDGRRSGSRLVRVRIGRGGRRHLDRRMPPDVDILPRRRTPWIPEEEGSSSMDVDVPEEEDDDKRRLLERWRFDSDDSPPLYPDEQDRMLVDEFDVGVLRHTMRMAASEGDMLTTDTTIFRLTADGRREGVQAFRLGLSIPVGAMRSVLPPQNPVPAQQRIQAQLMPNVNMNGATPPISMMKQQQHMNVRISNNGGMAPRPNNGAMSPPASTTPQGSPPNSAVSTAATTPRQHSPPNVAVNVVNGVPMRGAMTVPHVTENGVAVNGVTVSVVPVQQADGGQTEASAVNGQSFIQRSKSQDPQQPQQTQQAQAQHHLPQQAQIPIVNGYYTASGVPSTSALSVQQMQNLKSVFAGNMTTQDLSALSAAVPVGRTPYGAANFTLSMPPNGNMRKPQYQMMNGGTNSPSPMPRAPSRMLGASPHQQQQHTPSPVMQSQSPPQRPQQPPVGTNGGNTQGSY